MKNLLVIADKANGKNSALQRAIQLRQQAPCKITLLGFCYANIDHLEDMQLTRLSRSQLEKKITDLRKKQLQQLLTQFSIKPSTITTTVQWGKHIAPAITAYCKSHPVDLLLKSAGGDKTSLYTPTDWQLFRECPVPVLISTNKNWKKKARILAALDFSTTVKSKIKLNHNIIQQAQTLANLLGDELHIAFALKVPQPLIDMDLIEPKKYIRDKKQKLKPVIDQFCQQYNIAPNRVHIHQGKAAKVIPRIANNVKADIVVTGTVGRKGIKGKLIGNTAEGILQNLRTDIIAVKP